MWNYGGGGLVTRGLANPAHYPGAAFSSLGVGPMQNAWLGLFGLYLWLFGFDLNRGYYKGTNGGLQINTTNR